MPIDRKLARCTTHVPAWVLRSAALIVAASACGGADDDPSTATASAEGIGGNGGSTGQGGASASGSLGAGATTASGGSTATGGRGLDYGNYRPQVQGDYPQISGGRGGDVIHVTTLADSGPGSLREAADKSNAFIVFDVSGYVMLTSDLQITGSNVTIAGQTAPSPGIEIRCASECQLPLWIMGSNIVVQHVALRLGDTLCNSATELDGEDILFDHVSISWQEDEGFMDYHSSHHLYWRSLSAEALFYPEGTEVCGGGGADEGHGHLVYSGAHDITIMESLYVSNSYRNPMITGSTSTRLVNNLTYNWKTATGPFQNQLSGTPGDEVDAAWSVSAAGNRFIPGPATDASLGGYPYLFWYQSAFGTAAGGDRIYRSDNTIERNQYIAAHPDPLEDEYNALDYDPNVGEPPADALLVNFDIVSSRAVEDLVKANAGTRPLARSPVDARILAYINDRTGPGSWGLIQAISEVGAFPSLAENTSTWVDAADPNEIAPGQTFRTNREMKLEQEAAALEP